MTSAFENLAGPGKALRLEPPDANEFDGLRRMGLERLEDAQRKDLALASSFDLAYNAAHALCLAALRWHGYLKDLIAACQKVAEKVGALSPPQT